MGRKTIARFLLTTTLMGLPLTAAAQQAAQPPPQQGGGSDMDFSQPEQPQTQPEQPAQGGETGTSGAAPLQLDVPGGEVAAQHHPFQEDISAVQQIFALRNRRLELTPTVNFSLNDPYVQHTGFGLNVNYWISNVLAVGLSGVFFQGLNSPSEVNLFVGRSTNLVAPINEYQLAAAVNFTYVPLYGKFSMFSRYIFHWDMYLSAGVGVMRSRPISAIDPEVRTFNWNTAIMFDANIGVRIFFSRSVGLTLELRNMIYPELLERTRPITVADGPADTRNARADAARRNPANWVDTTSLTDNVMISVGLTVFLPFSFNYRLPK